MSAIWLSAGEVFDVPYPFVRERIDAPWQPEPETGMRSDTARAHPIPQIETWRPGTEYRHTSRSGDGVADAMGAQILTVVSVHRPAERYQARVFYTRQWRDPDGKVFGKGQLRILGLSAFVARTRGYMHPFELTAVSTEQAS